MSVTGTTKQTVDYHLEAIYLVAPAVDALDLMPYLVELSYFEDIFNCAISGKIVLSDAVGILNFGSLNGNEYVKLVFKKVTDAKQEVNRTFRLFSVNKRKIDENNDFESYSLEFCSDEFILGEQYRICKSFKSEKISNIIKRVLVDALKLEEGSTKKKKLYIDETNGVYDIVLSNRKIFETIQWLTSYALPATGDPGADMLFFENSFGYYFTSLQSLYKQKDDLVAIFNPKNIIQSNLKNSYKDYFNVMKIDFLDNFDSMSGLHNGTYNNRVITFDLIAREKDITDFNYDDYFKKSKHLNDFKVTNNYKNRFKKANYESPDKDKETGALRLSVANNKQMNYDIVKKHPDAVAKNFFVETCLPNRVAQLNLANYNRLRLTIPGNPSLVAGIAIKFIAYQITPLKKTSSSDQEREPDPYISGKYIITAARHIISPTSYITVLEIAKDSVNNPYVDGSDTWDAWNRIVDGEQS